MLKDASPKAADGGPGTRDTRDNWKALELYQEAYQQIFNRTNDEHNLALADICERMATCYVIMDKKGIALDWLTRAVSIRELCQGAKSESQSATETCPCDYCNALRFSQ